MDADRLARRGLLDRPAILMLTLAFEVAGPVS